MAKCVAQNIIKNRFGIILSHSTVLRVSNEKAAHLVKEEN